MGLFIAVGIPSGGLFTGAEALKTPEQAQRSGGTAGEPYDRCYHQACDGTDGIDRIALSRNPTPWPARRPLRALDRRTHASTACRAHVSPRPRVPPPAAPAHQQQRGPVRAHAAASGSSPVPATITPPRPAMAAQPRTA